MPDGLARVSVFPLLSFTGALLVNLSFVIWRAFGLCNTHKGRAASRPLLPLHTLAACRLDARCVAPTGALLGGSLIDRSVSAAAALHAATAACPHRSSHAAANWSSKSLLSIHYHRGRALSPSSRPTLDSRGPQPRLLPPPLPSRQQSGLHYPLCQARPVVALSLLGGLVADQPPMALAPLD